MDGIPWKWPEISEISLQKPMRNDRYFGTSKKQVKPMENIGFSKCGNTSQKHWKTKANLVKFYGNNQKTPFILGENTPKPP